MAPSLQAACAARCRRRHTHQAASDDSDASTGSQAEGSSGARRSTLPIFPLNVVALPSATVPLMIFEARYRVLFSTLLSGMDGVEEGLVQHDCDWCGTKRFGMCYLDNNGNMSSVGTQLEILEFAGVPDGRLFVTGKGRSRFRVIEVQSEKPIIVATVEELPEEPETEEVVALATEVADLLRSVIRLNIKMQNITATEDQLEPEELAELGARDLSYWVGSFFSDVTLLQQNLLEEASTLRRLQKEKEVLSETVSYYSAAAALKTAFASSPDDTDSGASRGS
uniref:Lon N-terminal domain-containing protein n=1 Tax=Chlamydomonas euryale TaxID=1486919 RepID=A0A7R9VVR1_9CHLO